MAAWPHVFPSNNLSYSENFLYMLDSLDDISYKHTHRLVRPLDALFIFRAEQEMNHSTASARHLASIGFDVYISLTRETGETRATGALYGPLH